METTPKTLERSDIDQDVSILSQAGAFASKIALGIYVGVESIAIGLESAHGSEIADNFTRLAGYSALGIAAITGFSYLEKKFDERSRARYTNASGQQG